MPQFVTVFEAPDGTINVMVSESPDSVATMQPVNSEGAPLPVTIHRLVLHDPPGESASGRLRAREILDGIEIGPDGPRFKPGAPAALRRRSLQRRPE